LAPDGSSKIVGTQDEDKRSAWQKHEYSHERL